MNKTSELVTLVVSCQRWSTLARRLSISFTTNNNNNLYSIDKIHIEIYKRHKN